MVCVKESIICSGSGNEWKKLIKVEISIKLRKIGKLLLKLELEFGLNGCSI